MIIRNAGDYKFSGYIIKSVLSEEAMIMSQRTTKVGHLPNRTYRNKQFKLTSQKMDNTILSNFNIKNQHNSSSQSRNTET